MAEDELLVLLKHASLPVLLQERKRPRPKLDRPPAAPGFRTREAPVDERLAHPKPPFEEMHVSPAKRKELASSHRRSQADERERGTNLKAGKVRLERPFGEFTRSVALPEGTDDVEARAHYANGVLEVHVEEREQSKPRRLPVTTTVEGGSTD